MIIIKKYLKIYIYIYKKKVIKKIPKKRNISPEKKQKVIDNLRSIMIIL